MKTINLGILAHVDAGKTTVTEGLLVHSGVKRRMGRVDAGTTTTDSMALERQRGMTIRAATVSFQWRETKINLIDTPGHMDFIAEVERSLAVLDGVILVVSAREGVQPQTRVIFEHLRAMRIPCILFINKIDRVGVSLEAVYAELRERLTPRILPMQHAVNPGAREASVHALPAAEILEAIVEEDDALLRAYLDGEAISPEAAQQSLRRQNQAGLLHPVYLGAALHDIGIAALLDAVVALFAPEEAPPLEAPLSAYIYKVEWDQHDHKWAYLRVFAGALHIREKVAHVGHEAPVYVRGLLCPQKGSYAPSGAICAGDIGVLLDAPHVRCGDFLGMETDLPMGARPSQPLLAVGVAPGPSTGRPALLNALGRLVEEDPNLHLAIHPQTEEITLRLYGVLQREIIEALLIERFGIHAVFSPLKTLYKEQPAIPTAADIPIFCPDNHLQAGIALLLEPLPTGEGIVYETRVSFGDLEKSFQNAVAEGVHTGLLEGLGEEIIDTKAIFTGMGYSSVTSTPSDYRRLAPLVVQKALRAVPLRRLEPWVSFTLCAPLSHQRKVLTAINRLRAVMDNVVHGLSDFTIYGEAPLDTTKEFHAELLSLTQGQGLFDARFLEYREV